VHNSSNDHGGSSEWEKDATRVHRFEEIKRLSAQMAKPEAKEPVQCNGDIVGLIWF